MYIVDSNIIIYSYFSEYEYLRKLFLNDDVFVSEVSRLEVLGYHRLTEQEYFFYKQIFDLIPVIAPNTIIFDKAITLRKSYNLKLGDSLIAATALVNDLTIYTRNVSDFIKIAEVKCTNPIDKD